MNNTDIEIISMKKDIEAVAKDVRGTSKDVHSLTSKFESFSKKFDEYPVIKSKVDEHDAVIKKITWVVILGVIGSLMALVLK